MGPSKLLEASGSGRDVPLIGDYHVNLTKLLKYNPTGPGQYKLPELFDNFKKQGSIDSVANVKRNPHYSFKGKQSKKMIITKEQLDDNMLTQSPDGPHLYPIRDKTFDNICKNNKHHNAHQNYFTRTQRKFPDRIKEEAEFISVIPCQHRDNQSLIGKGVSQAKCSPKFDPNVNKKFWELNEEH